MSGNDNQMHTEYDYVNHHHPKNINRFEQSTLSTNDSKNFKTPTTTSRSLTSSLSPAGETRNAAQIRHEMSSLNSDGGNGDSVSNNWQADKFLANDRNVNTLLVQEVIAVNSSSSQSLNKMLNISNNVDPRNNVSMVGSQRYPIIDKTISMIDYTRRDRIVKKLLLSQSLVVKMPGMQPKDSGSIPVAIDPADHKLYLAICFIVKSISN
uniref:Uncharacterized protein n=1 Tax=Glossina austeni TaxID=7395 RepID=A0A1A9VYA1_GLOAU